MSRDEFQKCSDKYFWPESGLLDWDDCAKNQFLSEFLKHADKRTREEIISEAAGDIDICPICHANEFMRVMQESIYAQCEDRMIDLVSPHGRWEGDG